MNNATTLKFLLALFVTLSFFQDSLSAQDIDHWETAVHHDVVWRYKTGGPLVPTDWAQPTYNDNTWLPATGGIGYGDGDDNTEISPVLSIAMRHRFQVADLSKIEMAVFHADFDDAFVAYLNGTEIARSNFGQIGVPPPFDQPSDEFHEADLYNGNVPPSFSFSKNEIANLLVNGENTLAVQVHNENFSSSDLSSNFWLSFAINDSSNDYEEIPDWFNPPVIFTSSNLPLLVINTMGQQIPNEPRIIAQLGIIDNGPNERNYLSDPFNGYDGQISIEIRGASSQGFAKKNYSFETQNTDSTNNNVSLLGMPKENDWVLHGPFADKSLLRNMLTYHFGNAMGRYAPRTRPCELIINGEYLGFYVLTERIKKDKNRVDIEKLDPEDIAGDELTGGYIIQIDRDNPDLFDGWYATVPIHVFYAFDDPDWDELAPQQAAYIQNYITSFEQAMNTGVFNSIYKDWIDEGSFIDYVIATEVAKHIDGFKLSFFMYKERDSNGGKLHLGPLWDINLGYGNFDFACYPGPELWSFDWAGICANQPFWLAKILTIPQVQHKMDCRWQELRQTVLHTDTLLQYIDDQVVLLGEAQERNFDRWQILGEYVWPNNFVGDTYEEEINFLKNWLTNRLEWMDDNMLGNCDLVLSDRELESLINFTANPNPFHHEINFTFHNDLNSIGLLKIYDAFGRLVFENEIQNDAALKWAAPHMGSQLFFYEFYLNNQLIESGKILQQ